MATRRLLNPARALPLTTFALWGTRAASNPPCLAFVVGPSCRNTHNGISSRGYATRSIKSPKPGATRQYWGPMDLSSVKEDDLKTYQQENPDKMRYGTSEYMQALDILSKSSTQAGHDWPLRVKEEYRPSKELLNDLACYLSEQFFSPRRQQIQHRAAMALFSGASALGCEASTVSVISILTSSAERDKVFDHPLFKPTVARFREILTRGRNPYALAIEGQQLLDQQKPQAAVRFLERAMQLGGPEFQWRPSCQYYLGMAYLKVKDEAKASEYLEKAAELGYKDAWHQLAKDTSKTDENRQVTLYQSGLLGDLNAFHYLARDFEALAQADGVTNEQQKELLGFAMEADRLATPTSPN